MAEKNSPLPTVFRISKGKNAEQNVKCFWAEIAKNRKNLSDKNKYTARKAVEILKRRAFSSLPEGREGKLKGRGKGKKYMKNSLPKNGRVKEG